MKDRRLSTGVVDNGLISSSLMTMQVRTALSAAVPLAVRMGTADRNISRRPIRHLSWRAISGVLVDGFSP
jgi:hypothetical protein